MNNLFNEALRASSGRVQLTGQSIVLDEINVGSLAPQLLSELNPLLSNLDDFSSELKRLGVKLEPISLEPLSWRDEQGFPKLVVVPLNGPVNHIGSEYTDFRFVILAEERAHFQYVGRVATSFIPDKVKLCYEDVCLMLADKCLSKRKENPNLRPILHITYDPGIASRKGIPSVVHEKLLKVAHLFPRDLYLIMEAKDWQMGVVTSTTELDPLLVGWKYDQFWLIDVFDLTPLEDYVKSEFGLGKEA